MNQMIDLIAVLMTVLLTGSELAIGVFVHPVLSRRQDAAHSESAKPLAQLLGRVMRTERTLSHRSGGTLDRR